MNMRLQLADRSICHPEGIIEDFCVWIGISYVPKDFVVLDTGRDLRAPIILGHPFLHIAKATIYMGSADICFHINNTKERSTFNSHKLQSPNMSQGQTSVIWHKSKKKNPPSEARKLTTTPPPPTQVLDHSNPLLHDWIIPLRSIELQEKSCSEDFKNTEHYLHF